MCIRDSLTCVLFAEFSIVSVDSGSYPRGIAIADVGFGTGNEVIVANFGAGTLIGQDGSGDTSSSIAIFSGGNKTVSQAGKSPRGVAAGDIDGDGKADYAVTNYDDGTVMIFTGSGTQTFEAGRHPVGVAIGDATGDGKNDVAVAVYSESKVVLFTRSMKNSWNKYELVVPGSPTDVTIGTLAGEPVIASANYGAGSVSIIKMDAAGLVKAVDIVSGGGACKVRIADVTGDGSNEIITANFFDNTISVIKKGFIGGFEEPVVYKLEGLRPNGMAVGDVNNDGLNDIVVANRDSDSIDILLQENGVLRLAHTVPASDDEDKTYGPVEAAIGDINNNGLNDIVFTHMRSGTIKVIYQKAGISFKDAAAEPLNEANTYNYPNPCEENTFIRFSSDKQQDVKILITDVSGRPVWTRDIPAASVRAGVNTVEWQLVNDMGAKVANGIYLLRVSAGERAVTKKIAVGK